MNERDAIARAGYEVWRRTSPAIHLPWAHLREHEREPWRRAAHEETAEDMWNERFAGYARPRWSRLPPESRERWERIALAMRRARIVNDTQAA